MLIETFRNAGFEIQAVKGNSRWGEHMVAINYDGVQYAIDHHGKMKNGIPDIEHDIKHLQFILSLYHEKVKAIYDYIVAQDIGDIWAMSGGGSQVQVFFGNKSGYIAILYLDDENNKIAKKNHTLQIQSAKNDKYFNGKISQFKMKGVQLRTHWESYGRLEEQDEDYDLIYNR